MTQHYPNGCPDPCIHCIAEAKRAEFPVINLDPIIDMINALPLEVNIKTGIMDGVDVAQIPTATLEAIIEVSKKAGSIINDLQTTRVESASFATALNDQMIFMKQLTDKMEGLNEKVGDFYGALVTQKATDA